jgi:hypothetical protein
MKTALCKCMLDGKLKLHHRRRSIHARQLAFRGGIFAPCGKQRLPVNLSPAWCGKQRLPVNLSPARMSRRFRKHLLRNVVHCMACDRHVRMIRRLLELIYLRKLEPHARAMDTSRDSVIAAARRAVCIKSSQGGSFINSTRIECVCGCG